jgi:adenylate kinase family enzyme
VGRHIAVVGTSGCGKTYVAQALAARLGITYVSNDAIIWRPNWQETPQWERLAQIDVATSADGWTFDGNLASRKPDDLIVLERCDTIVWLDLPRWQVWSQILRRTVSRVALRQELWHGNRESLRSTFSRDSILWWSVKSFAGRRRAYAALFADPTYADRYLVRLKSHREVERWLRGVEVHSIAHGMHA